MSSALGVATFHGQLCKHNIIQMGLAWPYLDTGLHGRSKIC